MTDADTLINDLKEFISNIVRVAPPESRSDNRVPSPMSLINIAVNISTHPLDELFDNKASEKKPYTAQEKKEPLIEVIENKNTIRVIAILPGIRKEDVMLDVKRDVLTVEINKYGKVYKKEIPCNAKADQISIKSSTLNNSVLEIVFDKV
jgi:HSP20 family protein